MKQVELHQAFCWTCDECGRDQFERAVTADLPRDEIEEAMRQAGHLEPWQSLDEAEGVDALMAPNQVTCRHCGSIFDTAEATG